MDILLQIAVELSKKRRKLDNFLSLNAATPAVYSEGTAAFNLFASRNTALEASHVKPPSYGQPASMGLRTTTFSVLGQSCHHRTGWAPIASQNSSMSERSNPSPIG